MLPFKRPLSAVTSRRRRRSRPLSVLLTLLLTGVGLVGGSIATNHDAWRRALPASMGGSGAQASAKSGAAAEAGTAAAGAAGARSGAAAEKSAESAASKESAGAASLVNRLIVSTPSTPRGAKPTVALTFDDGPHPLWTPKVLEILDRHRVKAVFCVLGENAEVRPDLISEMAKAGHKLCNHSYTHDFELASRQEPRIVDEVERTSAAIHEAAPDAEIPWYRAPGGFWAESVWEVTTDHGMQSLWWAQDPRDWDGPSQDLIVRRVMDNLHPGSVILLHDGGGNRSQTVAALERLIPRIRAQGYEFAMPATTLPGDADEL